MRENYDRLDSIHTKYQEVDKGGRTNGPTRDEATAVVSGTERATHRWRGSSQVSLMLAYRDTQVSPDYPTVYLSYVSPGRSAAALSAG